jgi:hypothetical protein
MVWAAVMKMTREATGVGNGGRRGAQEEEGEGSGARDCVFMCEERASATRGSSRPQATGDLQER